MDYYALVFELITVLMLDGVCLSDSHSDGTHSHPLPRHISTNLMKSIFLKCFGAELFLYELLKYELRI